MVRFILVAMLLTTSFTTSAQEISFDCTGTYTYDDGTSEVLTPKLDLDLSLKTGEWTNTMVRITTLSKVELTPNSLTMFYKPPYAPNTERKLGSIDRETLSAVLNGAVSTCKIVDRAKNRAF